MEAKKSDAEKAEPAHGEAELKAVKTDPTREVGEGKYLYSYVKKSSHEKRSVEDCRIYKPMDPAFFPRSLSDAVKREAQKLGFFLESVNKVDFNNICTPWASSTMVYRHLSGRSPLSLEAAQIYAYSLGCTVTDFSPRLAAYVQRVCDDLSFGKLPMLTWENALTPFDYVPCQTLPPVIKDPGERAEEMKNWMKRMERLKFVRRDFICPVKHSLSSFVLPITFRESTAPKSVFCPGEHIFVDPSRTPKSGDYVIVDTGFESRAILAIYEFDGGDEFLILQDVRFHNMAIDLLRHKEMKVVAVVLYKGQEIAGQKEG